MAEPNSASFVLVDPHPLFRAGIARTIEKFGIGEVVAQTGGGNDAIEIVERSIPDIAVLEIHLSPKRPNGVDIVRRWADSVPSLKTLILSSYSVDTYVRGAVDGGVKGYLLKTESESSIANGLNTVAQGGVVFSNAIHEKIRGWSERNSGTPSSSGHSTLTLREAEVIQFSSEGLSIEQISHRMSISRSTVQSHMTNVLSKLEAHTRLEAIITAARRGLVVIEAE